MKFKKNLEPIHTSDTWYDLFTGGYFKPSKLLKNKEEAKAVEDAMKLVEQFVDEAIEAGVIEEI